MNVIFCEDPLNRRQADEMYVVEANAVHKAGLNSYLINFEALTYEQNPAKAVHAIPNHFAETQALYRGWMLTPHQYSQLYNALLSKGLRLINTPNAYKHCHYLPESYEIIAKQTAVSVWLPLQGPPTAEMIMPLLERFGNNPIIVKDYVKSQKHYWNEACFIPDASDAENVMQIVSRFVELQGDSLNEGLVFREYIDLVALTIHSRSGMPLTKEFRVFVYQQEPLAISEYWEEGDYQGTIPTLAPFTKTINAIQSNFFTIDVAQKQDGSWIIMELGDGQVAGLPDTIDANTFYQKLVAKQQ